MVRLNGMKTAPFRFYKGVKQGNSLSLFLLNIVMDEVLKVCKRRTRRAIVGYWNMLPVQAQCFVYVDDIVVVADNVDSLQVAVEEWSEELQRRGLVINPGKSKIMQVGRRRRSSGLCVKDANWSKLISSNTWVLFSVGMEIWIRR